MASRAMPSRMISTSRGIDSQLGMNQARTSPSSCATSLKNTRMWALGLLQRFWYGTDKRREKFVAMCRDPDVQTLTWQSYTTKKLVRRRPFAHIRVFFKDVAQLLGLARA